jgi:hypothetical protein
MIMQPLCMDFLQDNALNSAMAGVFRGCEPREAQAGFGCPGSWRRPGCSSGGGRGCCGPGRTASWCGDRRGRRRVAGCRSSRVPRPLSKTGPRTLEAAGRSMARPAAGGSGTRTVSVPLPHTRRTRWPCSAPRSAMSAPAASKIRRPGMAARAKPYRLAGSRAAVSRAPGCRWADPGAGDSAGTAGRRTCPAGGCSRMPGRCVRPWPSCCRAGRPRGAGGGVRPQPADGAAVPGAGQPG